MTFTPHQSTSVAPIPATCSHTGPTGRARSNNHLKSLLLGGVLLSAALSARAAPGDLSASDVVGVAPGQTADQVEAILRARDPRMRIVKVYWRGFDGKPTNTVARIAAGVELPGMHLHPTSDAPKNAPDWLMVYFTQTSSLAYAIYRQVDAGPQGLLATDFLSALEKKYGPRYAESPVFIYNRALDKTGKSDSNCSTGGFRFTVSPTNLRESCGQSINVTLTEPSAPGVYRYATTWFIDQRIAVADVKASQALANAQRDQANQRAIEGARNTKPSL